MELWLQGTRITLSAKRKIIMMKISLLFLNINKGYNNKKYKQKGGLMKWFTFTFTIYIFMIFQTSCSSDKLVDKYLEHQFIKNLINKEFELAKKYLTKLEKVYEEMNESQKCDYHFYKGCYFYSLKEFKKAEEELSTCLDINSSYVQALYARAKLNSYAFNNKKAVKEDYQQLLKILRYVKSKNDYDNPTISLYTIEENSSITITMSPTEEAEKHYDYRYRNFSLDQFILEILGELESIEIEDQNYHNAIKYIYEILQYPMAILDYRRELGDCYFYLEQYENAIENYTIYLSKPKIDYIVYYRRGLCYFRLDDYEVALREFNRSLVEINNPEKSSSIEFIEKMKNEKSDNYFHNHNFYKKQIQDQIESISKTKTSVLFYKSRCYEKMNQFDKAIDTMTELLEFDNDYELAYYYRGYFYNEQKELYKAVEDFKKALEIDSGLTQLYYSIAVNYDNLKNYDLAKRYYNLYIEYHEDKNSQKYKYALRRYDQL